MSRRLSTDKPFTCVTCEIDIAGAVTFHVGLPFCCAGCVADGPCTCSYDTYASHTGVRHCLDVVGAERTSAGTQIVEKRPARHQSTVVASR
jgi:hypothetical protein